MLCYRYYGTNSVCIPRLFVTKKDSSWQFSIAVTGFNFAAFVFVALAYFGIILKTTKKPDQLAKSGSVQNPEGDKKAKGD